MKETAIFIIFLCCIVACVPVSQQGNGTSVNSGAYYTDKKFRTIDSVYEEEIKTVLLYPKPSTEADQVAAVLEPPVISIGQTPPLLLEF